jgi:MoxR-like ATPase
MKSNDVKASLNVLLKSGRPVFVWGPPGVGKSDTVRQIAKTNKLSLIDVRTLLLDPVDLRGLPHVNGDHRAHWATPDFLPREGKGILFLDELNAAPPLVQAACYQLVLDRKLGEYTLPDGWNVIAAGNRDTDRAVTHRMPSALANRFVHLEFEVDNDSWFEWAFSNDVREEVIAFIKFRPNLLHEFDPAKNDKAFPTPRSWEFVSDIIKESPASNIEYELFKGTVGEGAATEFVSFIRIFRDLPNPDAIILDPDGADVPKNDPAIMYALCVALSKRATEENFGSIVKYANRIPDEYSVLLVSDAIKRDTSIANNSAFTLWAKKHAEIVM